MLRFIILALMLTAANAFAQHFDLETKILTPAQIKKVIAAYPEKGSIAEFNDYKILLAYQLLRTANDCQLAAENENTSLAQIFGAVLSEDEVSRMSKFMLKALASSGINALIAKKTFNRPRPYVANPLIKPCISLENSAAYPSGHTMIARVYARILSAVYPERAEKFLALADQYAEYRVIGGVHHPSDVKSGKILADHLATKMIDTEDFVHELASR